MPATMQHMQQMKEDMEHCEMQMQKVDATMQKMDSSMGGAWPRRRWAICSGGRRGADGRLRGVEASRRPGHAGDAAGSWSGRRSVGC